MNLVNLLKGLLNLQKKIDVKKLPSQGLFYRDDFEIIIKKADVEDIIEYEHNYIKDDLGSVIYKLKKVVEKNSTFSKGYTFNDIKSIDIIFLFLEVVRFTKGKAVNLTYFNDEFGEEEDIEFGSNYFNYFKLDDDIMRLYDNESKQFVVDGFQFSLPSIGAESCITNFLVDKIDEQDATRYNDYSYNFIFFLNGKRTMSFNEVDNLIQIFNFDMEDSDVKKVTNIVKMFQPIQKYSLKRDGKVIDINSKIDLEKIWK
jgi:hypothetical protein